MPTEGCGRKVTLKAKEHGLTAQDVGSDVAGKDSSQQGRKTLNNELASTYTHGVGELLGEYGFHTATPEEGQSPVEVAVNTRGRAIQFLQDSEINPTRVVGKTDEHEVEHPDGSIPQLTAHVEYGVTHELLTSSRQVTT